MSKEQALGLVSEIGTHSDVFSLGIILYEIFNGKPPFVGSPQGVLEQARKGRKNTSNQTSCTCSRRTYSKKKATHPDWKNRYPTAKEFADDLRKWMIGLDKKAKGRKKVKEALEKERNYKHSERHKSKSHFKSRIYNIAYLIIPPQNTNTSCGILKIKSEIYVFS